MARDTSMLTISMMPSQAWSACRSPCEAGNITIRRIAELRTRSPNVCARSRRKNGNSADHSGADQLAPLQPRLVLLPPPEAVHVHLVGAEPVGESAAGDGYFTGSFEKDLTCRNSRRQAAELRLNSGSLPLRGQQEDVVAGFAGAKLHITCSLDPDG